MVCGSLGIAMKNIIIFLNKCIASLKKKNKQFHSDRLVITFSFPLCLQVIKEKSEKVV